MVHTCICLGGLQFVRRTCERSKKIIYSLDRFFGLDTDPRFGFFCYISEKLCGTFLNVLEQDVTYQQIGSNIDLKPEKSI